MPSIKDESTVEKIAQVFCGEGKRNRGESLRIVGYAESTCISGKALEDVYGNLRVKAAIARKDAVNAQIGNRTVKDLDRMYQKGYDVAETQKNPTGMATNTTGIARLYGMDKDAGASGGDAVPDLSEQQRKAAIAASKAVTGPTLTKETA